MSPRWALLAPLLAAAAALALADLGVALQAWGVETARLPALALLLALPALGALIIEEEAELWMVSAAVGGFALALLPGLEGAGLALAGLAVARRTGRHRPVLAVALAGVAQVGGVGHWAWMLLAAAFPGAADLTRRGEALVQAGAMLAAGALVGEAAPTLGLALAAVGLLAPGATRTGAATLALAPGPLVGPGFALARLLEAVGPGGTPFPGTLAFAALVAAAPGLEPASVLALALVVARGLRPLERPTRLGWALLALGLALGLWPTAILQFSWAEAP